MNHDSVDADTMNSIEARLADALGVERFVLTVDELIAKVGLVAKRRQEAAQELRDIDEAIGSGWQLDAEGNVCSEAAFTEEGLVSRAEVARRMGKRATMVAHLEMELNATRLELKVVEEKMWEKQ